MQCVPDCVKNKIGKGLQSFHVHTKKVNVVLESGTKAAFVAVTQRYMHLKHAAGNIANKKEKVSTLHRSKNSYMF